MRTLSCVVAFGIATAGASAPYCLPGDACYPTVTDFKAFNNSVNGTLIKIEPYGRACYAGTYDKLHCQEVAIKKTTEKWRVDLPAAAQYPNFEVAANGSGCPVPDLGPGGAAPEPIQAPCTIGRMSNYVVNASSIDHVIQSVKFAAKFNLRFRVKNTGHCFSGRSLGEGSLALWTHHLTDVELIRDFVPHGSKTDPQNVIAVGPGMSVADLYKAAASFDGQVVGGMSPQVGATGGWILGGGVGPFGARHGMGVDNVVQYDVVTADGVRRTANEAVNADLFWALRGGGGAFAVVVKAFIKLHPAMSAINTIGGAIVCNSREAYFKAQDTLVDLQLPLSQEEYSGAFSTLPENNTIAILAFDMFNSSQAVKSTNQSQELLGPLRFIPGCDAQLQIYQTTGAGSWLDVYERAVLPEVEASVPVGRSLATLSRIISVDLMSTEEGREKVKKGLRKMPVPIIWQNTVGAAVRRVAPQATSVHPSWRTALAFLDVSIFGDWKSLDGKQEHTIDISSAILDETFGSAVYYNEWYGSEKDWQDAEFGSNYKRLLQVKKDVDPYGLFNCHNCVGSEQGY